MKKDIKNEMEEKWGKYLEMLRENDDYEYFLTIDEELQKSPKFIEEAVKIHPEIYMVIDEELKTESITLATLSADSKNNEDYFTPEEIRRAIPKEQLANQEILIRCISNDIYMDEDEYYDDEIQKYKNDKEFFSKLLDKAYSWSILYVYYLNEIDIKNDADTMVRIIKEYYKSDKAFDFSDQEIFERILEKFNSDDQIRNTKEVFKELGKRDMLKFSMFGDELREDIDFMVEVIKSAKQIHIHGILNDIANFPNEKKIILRLLSEDILSPEIIEKEYSSFLKDLEIKEMVKKKKEEIEEQKTEEKIFKALLQKDKEKLKEDDSEVGLFYKMLLIKRTQEAPEMDIDEYIRKKIAAVLVHKLLDKNITKRENIKNKSEQYMLIYPEVIDDIVELCDSILVFEEDIAAKTYTLK